jgi:hypothetical protein
LGSGVGIGVGIGSGCDVTSAGFGAASPPRRQLDTNNSSTNAATSQNSQNASDLRRRASDFRAALIRTPTRS